MSLVIYDIDSLFVARLAAGQSMRGDLLSQGWPRVVGLYAGITLSRCRAVVLCDTGPMLSFAPLSELWTFLMALLFFKIDIPAFGEGALPF